MYVFALLEKKKTKQEMPEDDLLDNLCTSSNLLHTKQPYKLSEIASSMNGHVISAVHFEL